MADWGPFLSYWGNYCKDVLQNAFVGSDTRIRFSEGLLRTLYYETDVGSIPRGIKMDCKGAVPKFGSTENWNRQIQGCYWCQNVSSVLEGICCQRDCLYFLHEFCIERAVHFTRDRFCRLPGCDRVTYNYNIYCCEEHRAKFDSVFPKWTDSKSTSLTSIVRSGPTWYKQDSSKNTTTSIKAITQPQPTHSYNLRNTSAKKSTQSKSIEVKSITNFPLEFRNILIHKTDIGVIPRRYPTGEDLTSKYSQCPNWLAAIKGCYYCGRPEMKDPMNAHFCRLRCYLLFYEWCRRKVESLTKISFCQYPECPRKASDGFQCCNREHTNKINELYSGNKIMNIEQAISVAPKWYVKSNTPHELVPRFKSQQMTQPVPVYLSSHFFSPIGSRVTSRDILQTDSPRECTKRIQPKARPYEGITNDNVPIERNRSLPVEPEVSHEKQNSGFITDQNLGNSSKAFDPNPFSPSNLALIPGEGKYQLPDDYGCTFDIPQTDNMETELENESSSKLTHIISPNQMSILNPQGKNSFVSSDDVQEMDTSRSSAYLIDISDNNIPIKTSTSTDTCNESTLSNKNNKEGNSNIFDTSLYNPFCPSNLAPKKKYQLPDDYECPFVLPRTDFLHTKLEIEPLNSPSLTSKLTCTDTQASRRHVSTQTHQPVAQPTTDTVPHNISTSHNLRLQKSQSLIEPNPQQSSNITQPDIYPFSLSTQLTDMLSQYTDVGAIPRPRAPQSPAPRAYTASPNWGATIAGCYWCKLSNTSFHELTCGRRCWLLFHEWCIRKIETSCGARLCALPGCENSRASGCMCCSLEHIRDITELRECASLSIEDEVELILGPNWYSDLSPIHLSRTGAFYEFSNYFPSLLILEGSIWPTVYHYLCARKLIGTPYSNHVSHMECVKELEMWMKRRTCGKWVRADWSSVWERDTYTAVFAKFQQNSVLRGLLLRTGRRPLVCRDSPLGDMLFGLRERFRAQRFFPTGQLEASINSVCKSINNPSIVSEALVMPSQDGVKESLTTGRTSKSIQIPKDNHNQLVCDTYSDSD